MLIVDLTEGYLFEGTPAGLVDTIPTACLIWGFLFMLGSLEDRKSVV
jgi:hypothetical protein